jgi:hypothetical protein
MSVVWFGSPTPKMVENALASPVAKNPPSDAGNKRYGLPPFCSIFAQTNDPSAW